MISAGGDDQSLRRIDPEAESAADVSALGLTATLVSHTSGEAAVSWRARRR